VLAVHRLENAIRARLDRQMQIRHQGFDSAMRRNQVVRHVARMAGDVAQALQVFDLSQTGATRCTNATSVPAVVLPRRVNNTHLILPNFSPGGNYVVSVTTDRSGALDKAAGHAIANVQGYHVDLTVTLDLRSIPPGTFFLATTHEGDPASYFYPLTVR